MNRSLASFGNRSHGKGLLVLSDDEDDSCEESDYYAKAHQSSSRGNRSISGFFAKQKQSDDDSLHLSGNEEEDDNKSTKSFLSKVVSKSFGGGKRQRNRSKSNKPVIPINNRRSSEGTASTTAPSSPRSSPEPRGADVDDSSWGNIDPEESLSKMFLSPEDSGAAQLVFTPRADPKPKVSSPPSSPPMKEEATPRSPSSSPQSPPSRTKTTRQAPHRSKTTGSMSMMFLSDMDPNHVLQMQCADSCAGPKTAPSKRKKNKDAIEAYNAKVAAKKAAKAKAAAESKSTSSGPSAAAAAATTTATAPSHAKQKVKIRVKVPKGSDPAVVAAMAKEQEASSDGRHHKVPMRIKRSDDATNSPTKPKRGTVGNRHAQQQPQQQPTSPTSPRRTRSTPLTRRAHSVRKLSTTEGEETSHTPSSPRQVPAHAAQEEPDDSKTSSPKPASPRSRRWGGRAPSKRNLRPSAEHETAAPASPKKEPPDQEDTTTTTTTTTTTPSSPKTPRTRRLGRAPSRRHLTTTSSKRQVSVPSDATDEGSSSPKTSSSPCARQSPRRLTSRAHSKRNVAVSGASDLCQASTHSGTNTTRTFSNRRDTNARHRPQRTEPGMRSSVKDRIRQFNG